MTREIIKSLLEELPVKRLRAEAVLDELLSSGFCRHEDLVVYPESSPSTFFERNVSDIEQIFDPNNGRSWFKVNAPRDGFYDTLPERLFHRSAGRVKQGEEWDEIRAEETKQEIEARQFFLPFDNAVNHQRISIEKFEKEVLAGQDLRFLKEFMAIFWPDASELELTDEQNLSLFHLTIIAHKVAGNIDWMEECFALMLGDAVKLYYEDIDFAVPVNTDFEPVGHVFLGVNSILLPTDFIKWKRLKIQVGPLSYERMSNYFPGKKGERLVTFLCHLLIPAEVDWVIDLQPLDEKTNENPDTLTPVCFLVNDIKNYAVLGYTTVL